MPSIDPANLTDLGAVEAAQRVRTGEVSASALVEACLARIAALDPTVKAWTHVDAEGARAAAKERDAQARAGRSVGALHGVPVGIKDIFHVAGLPTTAGARPHFHSRPQRDASSVARLKAAGAIVLGKTATTEFAYRDPAPTRNPWNREHTPGGSSAGSGAAVGARMVPLALGSQTVGSVLRPAAYCGVVGFKPTHGFIPADGVIPLAWSLDHVGIFGRAVADVALAASVLIDRLEPVPVKTPRFALVPALLGRAAADVAQQIRAAAGAFARAGAEVVEVDLPPEFARIDEVGRVILEVEAAAYHEPQHVGHAAEFGKEIRALIEAGLRRSAGDYARAQAARLAFRDAMTPVLRAFDALLSPTAPTPAPAGLASTGDASFCAPWSFAGVPSITLPSGVAADGLPHAIQLVQAADAPGRLLGVAAWCERVLAFSARPRLP